MPTFERCPACLRSGVPMDESPIVPEGKLCERCELCVLRDETGEIILGRRAASATHHTPIARLRLRRVKHSRDGAVACIMCAPLRCRFAK